ncbi:mannose-6-phosphate isomerase, class I [Robertkochia marina]|uniref:mannose-6-phosphate isomerase n=1 Tax=Robertkochia marina TaxID=1227945 RepID=A0A4S3M130_9FLAO|nr:mannose-6-phosphate isomerase, class I [Robertkochia marina]TRZ44694.1 mannose-6-phosphate isomerase, class I [Robertkochia marina]
MRRAYALNGKIQSYAWGGKDFVPELLGIEKNGNPFAEYWLGTHSKGPSQLVFPEGEIALQTYLKSLKKNAVSESELSFLFKVLDVEHMLSIQVHPSKEAAVSGFDQENSQGIPLDHPHRNFKDANHKPEIMVALSEFWLLHGFMPADGLLKRMRDVPEFHSLIPELLSGGLKGLYTKVMHQHEKERNAILRPLLDRIIPQYQRGELSKQSPHFWAAKAALQFGSTRSVDKGIYSIYFFNLVQLQRGEAIYQAAGVPHAYLKGQNIELMANSDNVLRGGLTTKHVDVPELLNHINFEETIPSVLRGTLQADQMERIYHCEAPDFQISRIDLPLGRSYKSKAVACEILLVIKGEVVLNEPCGHRMQLKKGKSVFIGAECEYDLSASSEAIVFKATRGKTKS